MKESIMRMERVEISCVLEGGEQVERCTVRCPVVETREDGRIEWKGKRGGRRMKG